MAQPISALDRILTVVLTPLVLAWDLFRKVVFGFFALLERLDPIAAIARLFKRLGPLASRVWAALLPMLHRLRALVAVVERLFLRVARPVVRRVSPILSAAWRGITRVAAPIVAAIRSVAREVHQSVAPALRAAGRLWRAATAPIRRVVVAVRGRLRSAVKRVSLLGRSRFR